MISRIKIDENSEIIENFYDSSVIKTIKYACVGKTNNINYEVDFKIYYSPDEDIDKFSVKWLHKTDSFPSLQEAKEFIFNQITKVKDIIDQEQEIIKEFRSWNIN